MVNVMLVDDEASIRRALRALFERTGFQVSEAASAEAALAAVAAGPTPDAMVCDVLMPGKNGVALYDALVETAPGLAGRIVFLTGAAHEPAVCAPIEARGVPLVSKFDDLHLVVDAVRVGLLKG
ncbi:MAG: response regulator [Gemmatimonadales bacterium]|nr:response regulator [Gemmatimonadales bacterium]